MRHQDLRELADSTADRHRVKGPRMFTSNNLESFDAQRTSPIEKKSANMFLPVYHVRHAGSSDSPGGYL